ncbi:MAG: hypothetical protein PWP37_1232 [Thermotogota bacterium]|nr:hypothetical protein [Thermotogota bacterium]MDK2865040.1 hypothetical protein [Thermotogota bacterium]HCZ06669.1 ABC transporter permease [Thermotogota bacterium]
MKRRRFIVETLVVAILLLFWQYNPLPEYVLPGPVSVAKEIIRTAPLIWRHTVVTLYESLVGYLLSFVFGVAIATLMYLLPGIGRSLLPVLVFTQTIPVVVIAPIIVIWFGFGVSTKIGTVAFLCFFPIAINTYDGFRTVDPDSLDLFKVYRARWYQRMRFLLLPHALPYIFSGMKVAVTYAITAAVVAEWMGAEMGLGIYLIRALNSFRVERVFAGVVVIIAFTLGLFYILDRVSRKIAPWTVRSEGGAQM